MTPRVSVIIPVYNGAKHVGEAIESVLAQTSPAHEIIVVDDGSTDATPEVLARFGQKIRTERIPNSGPSGARNAGLGMAVGDWIAFLDADDLWFPGKLKKQLEMAGRYPEAGFICTDFLSYDDADGTKRTRHFEVLRNFPGIRLDAPLDRDPFLVLMKNNIVGTSTVLMSREAVRLVGRFEPRYYNSQDFDYWSRAARVVKFLLVSEVLMEKRPHAANWSRDKIKAWTCKKMILTDMLERLVSERAGVAHVKACRLCLANLNYKLGTLYFEAGDTKRAFEIYREGLRSSPGPSNFLRYLNVSLKKRAKLIAGGAA